MRISLFLAISLDNFSILSRYLGPRISTIIISPWRYAWVTSLLDPYYLLHFVTQWYHNVFAPTVRDGVGMWRSHCFGDNGFYCVQFSISTPFTDDDGLLKSSISISSDAGGLRYPCSKRLSDPIDESLSKCRDANFVTKKKIGFLIAAKLGTTLKFCCCNHICRCNN